MATVKYNIGGKYDSKGVKAAQNGFKSLGQQVKSMMAALGAVTAIVAVVKKVADYGKESAEAFNVQQDAINGLSKAVANNANLTTASLKNIQDYASEIQSQSIYGDEAVIEQAKLLAGMGMTEEQIKKTLKASVEYASYSGESLSSSVYKFSKTLTGQTGLLKVHIPELKNLTKAELENGAAIDIAIEKYKGFAEASTQTLSGLSTQVNNISGDIKEKVGTIFANIKFDSLEKIKPFLEKIDSFLNENADKITAIFVNLPDVARLAFTTIKNFLPTLFTFDFWINYFSSLGKLTITILKNTLRSVVDIIVALGVTIWEPLKFGLEWAGYGIQVAWTSIVNFILKAMNTLFEGLSNGINKIIDKINVVRGWLGMDAMESFTGLKQLDLKDAPEKPESSMNKDNVGDAWKKVGTNFLDGVSEITKGFKNFGGEMGDLFAEPMSEFKDGITEIMNRPVKISITNDSTDETGTTDTDEKEKKSFMSKLATFVNGLKLTALIKELGTVTQIMEPLNVILTGIMNILTPAINDLLNPLIGMLTIAGETIGQLLLPILQLLTPIVEALATAFIWFYNKVILPVGNFIMKLFQNVANFFVNMMNGVITALNKIPFVNISKVGKVDLSGSMLQEISATTVSSAGASASGSSSSSTGASYTAAKDITVNFYYNNSYVNGDAREIAINLRNEIRMAEKLGY